MHDEHSPEPARGHLIVGLVGDGHRELYLRSAEFKARINLLADMLPAWVDGLAATAATSDEQAKAAVVALANGPWPTLADPRRSPHHGL